MKVDSRYDYWWQLGFKWECNFPEYELYSRGQQYLRRYKDGREIVTDYAGKYQHVKSPAGMEAIITRAGARPSKRGRG